jgi:hypothetical protein
MDLMLKLNIPKPQQQISFRDKILSVGSCFTEHIGNALKDLKFGVLQNPNGILFDPASVCKSLQSYTNDQNFNGDDLFQLNELWHSWDYHSRFSSPSKQNVIENINRSKSEAHLFLKNADWVIITLGSSFSYWLKKEKESAAGVANCHRAPAQWFEKHLSSVKSTTQGLEETVDRLKTFNYKLKFIFTISPVRHIRDGVIENNRSKARLIESVHQVVNNMPHCYYFPSYELVIDVLRDYRFYAEDLVHPNYLATDFVLENFIDAYISEESRPAINEIKKLNISRKHRSAHPGTQAHKKFLKENLEKVRLLQQQYPFIDFSEEINYFNSVPL